jgi:putative flippase GtrA
MATPVVAEHVGMTCRFAAVGLVATGLYFGITVCLGGARVGMEPVGASTIGFVVSIAASYVGHHRFTFRATGQHEWYLPRFLFVMTSLFAISTLAMALCRHVWHLDHVLVSAGISVAFPIASYFLNWLWAFRHRDR